MTKVFDDADAYLTSIRRLVPGYDVLAQLARMHVSEGALPARGLCVVGPGPGPELVELARRVPGCPVHAVEPSEAMAASCRRYVAQASLEDRVTVHVCPVSEVRLPMLCDVAVCLLVAHFIADDGRRAGFWGDLAALVHPGGRVITAEIESMTVPMRDRWVAWAADQGLAQPQRDVLRRRLTAEFSCVTPSRTEQLARDVGLVPEATLMRVLGVSLRSWIAPGTSAH